MNSNLLFPQVNLRNHSGSSKLHTAIKEAYNKGILIIAAAGDSSGVKYPAKYVEVMAVGAVKCNGKLSTESPIGEEIEVVAPGEDVTSYGPFGMINNFSGTSIAAPQVTALASVLWQQDASKDANFIRGLIKATARPLGSKLKFGEGLIDCSYALSQYETYASSIQKASVDSAFSETEGNESNVETNNSEIIKYEEDVVKGYWGTGQHEKMANKILVLKRGAVWPDKKKSKINGMTDNPLFHGYYKGNYINAYKKITWIASKMYKAGKFPSSNNKVTKRIIADVKKATKKNGFAKCGCTTKEQKALFIYGMAMHTTADIFAHSTSAVRWKKIDQSKKKKKKNVSIKKLKKQRKKLTHGKRQANGKFSKNLNFADNTTYIPNRINSARSVCSSILNTCITKKTKGSIIVFKNVKYYASKGTASKYKSKSKKKKYLKNSYGIFNLSTYLKPTEVKGKNRKKLKKVVNSVANNKVKKIFEKW